MRTTRRSNSFYNASQPVCSGSNSTTRGLTSISTIPPITRPRCGWLSGIRTHPTNAGARASARFNVGTFQRRHVYPCRSFFVCLCLRLMAEWPVSTLNKLDVALEMTLRPSLFFEFTGQAKVKERLEIAVAAAKQRGEVLDHIFLNGLLGLNKT